MKPLLLLIPLMSGLSLTGCASHVVSEQVIEALLVNDRRSHDALANDLDMDESIKKELKGGGDALWYSHVVTAVYNGKVLVAGELPDAVARAKLIDGIRTIKGVKEVHDSLAGDAPISPALQSQDQAIKERLLAALGQIRTIDGFRPSMVNVIVENGVVYLMGLVHRNEGATAVNVVRHQSGVRQVVTIFEYLD